MKYMNNISDSYLYAKLKYVRPLMESWVTTVEKDVLIIFICIQK